MNTAKKEIRPTTIQSNHDKYIFKTCPALISQSPYDNGIYLLNWVDHWDLSVGSRYEFEKLSKFLEGFRINISGFRWVLLRPRLEAKGVLFF